MRYHEREDVILSKTRKMVRDGVPDPALVLQYEKLAREARMPCGTFIEGGNRVRKPPTRLQEKENNLRLANMSRRFSNSKKMAHEVSKLRSLCEDWKKEALALRAKIEDVDRKASTPNSTPSSSRSTKTRYPGDWKSTDVTAIARMGRRCMNLVLAIFGKNRVQPYVYAMLIELPVQLKLYQSRCQDLGIPADTTALNAQNSEHVNKIMKDIEHSMSSHNKVVAHDSPDVGDHTESRMFLVFLHEHITKRKAFTHDLLTYKLLRTCNTDANHILPDQKVCNVCGHARESATHKSICEHVWMPELEAIMESGKLTDDLKEYLSSDEALTMLSYQNLGGNVAQRPRQRLRKVTSTTAEMRQQRAKTTKSRASKRRRKH
ncbi:hypothetical protein AAMO2058_001748700 [Amorphochlora amoebiformis]